MGKVRLLHDVKAKKRKWVVEYTDKDVGTVQKRYASRAEAERAYAAFRAGKAKTYGERRQFRTGKQTLRIYGLR